jgi:hypothetical protein
MDQYCWCIGQCKASRRYLRITGGVVTLEACTYIKSGKVDRVAHGVTSEFRVAKLVDQADILIVWREKGDIVRILHKLGLPIDRTRKTNRFELLRNVDSIAPRFLSINIERPDK